MNHLDDFLKQKLGNTEAESTSGWAALEKAIPARKTTGAAFKWALVALLAGITASSVYFFGNRESQIAESAPQHQSAPSPETANVPAEQQSAVNENLAGAGALVQGKETVSVNPPQAARPSASQGSSRSNSKPVPMVDNRTTPDPVMNNETPKPDNNSVVVAEDKSITETPQKEVTIASPEKEMAVVQPEKANRSNVRKPTKADFQKGKLYVNASFSPMMSYRNWQLNNGYAPFVHKQFTDIRESSDKMVLSFATGLGMEYRFNRTFSLQSGLFYQVLGYRSNYDYEVTDEATLDASGRVIGYTSKASAMDVTASKLSRYSSVRIPLILNYNIMITPATYFHLSAGPGITQITGVKSTGIDPVTLQLKEYSLSDFKRFSSDLYMSMGFNTAITPKLGFVIDMFYDQWLNDISKSAYEKNLPFTAGFNVALHRKIF